MNENKNFNALPLEFQKINVETKILSSELKTRKSTISINFYQSKNVFPDFFYKPISKINNIDVNK